MYMTLAAVEVTADCVSWRRRLSIDGNTCHSRLPMKEGSLLAAENSSMASALCFYRAAGFTVWATV